MAIEQEIFSLYITNSGQYFLFRTVRPDFSNASQGQENDSWEQESKQRDMLMNYVGELYAQKVFARVGELHGYPIGEVFYSDFGNPHISLYYMQTEFGEPWIVFGTADSEEEFLTELQDDDELLALKPIGKPIKVDACFVTFNDL